MQIRVDKLRTNLSLLQPVIPKKPTMTMLTSVLVMDGKLVASDLETSVSVAVPEAQGTFLIPFRSIMELLKYVPGDEMLTIEPDTSVIKLSWKGGSASYDVTDAKDYPPLYVKERKAEGSLNGDMLVSAMVAAIPYCATDEKRPVLSGITLYLGDPVTIAGADGFRLSYQTLKLSYPVQQTIVIPAHTVGILEHLWRRSPATVPLSSSLVSQLTAVRQLKLCLREDAMVEVQFGNVTLFCKPIEGNPPDHLALLNNFQEPIKVMLMATEMHNVVRRLQGIAKDGSGAIFLRWTDAIMTVSAKSVEKGESSAEIPVLSASVPGRVAVNFSYLLDYLAGKDGFVTMGMAEGGGAAIFHYGAAPVVAIMPMDVRWDEDEDKPKQPGDQEQTEPVEPGESQEPEEGEEEPAETEDLREPEGEEMESPETEPVELEASQELAGEKEKSPETEAVEPEASQEKKTQKRRSRRQKKAAEEN